MLYWRTNHMKNKNPDNVTVATPAADKLIDEVLCYLVDEKGWQVVARDTHRWIDSDGWYELEFALRSQDGIEDVYLHTHSTHDREFEEEWSREGDTYVEISDIYWDDKDDWDSRYAMVMIRKNNKAWRALTTELRKKIKTLLCSDPNGFWKKEFYCEQN